MTAPDAPDAVLRESGIPGYGVVRTVIVDGVHAARFDDLNGDGREIEVSVFVRRDRTWSRVGHQDDVGIPAVDETPLFGWTGTGGWAVGRATPGERVEVDWMGERAVPEEDGGLSWPGPRTRSFT